MRWAHRFLALAMGVAGCGGEAPADDRAAGPDDMVSRLSCDAPIGVPLAAATSLEAAGEVAIVLPTEVVTSGNPYRVTLPEDAESYAVLRVATMHNDVALFVSARDMIVGLEPDGIPSGRRHANCDGELTDDYRVHVHAPGDYRMTFSAGGPREITVVASLAALGHGDHDGGHGDHDGGHP